ncbi:hypothetical protein REPUB_Repub10bG0023500 [Reevesia pubescens]
MKRYYPLHIFHVSEYKSIRDSFQTSDYYAGNVCLQAFQHIQCQFISFIDNKGHKQSVEFRPVKLLISPAELHQGIRHIIRVVEMQQPRTAEHC